MSICQFVLDYDSSYSNCFTFYNYSLSSYMQYRESQMENSTLTTNKETACDDMSLENHNMDLETTKNRLLLFNDTLQKKKGND